MPPILIKDLIEEIKHSLGRYLSILAIVSLGVAFFAGIKASAPDMKNTADLYFDRYNLQDIQVFSTIGLNEEDLEALREVEGVEEAQGQFSNDYLTKIDSREIVVKLMSYSAGQSINQPRLIEGRMPENEDECLLQADSASGQMFGSFDIGQTIDLYSGTATPIEDDLNRHTFTIVGKVNSPNYLSYELGTSAIGSGTVNTFVYVPESVIKADYYTEIDVTVEGAKALDSYSSRYFDQVDPVVANIEEIADGRIQDTLDSYYAKIDEEEKKAKEKLDDAQSKLDEAKEKLDEGQKQLDEGKKKLEESRKQLDEGKKQYNDGVKQLQDARKQVNDGLEQVNNGIAQFDDARQKLDELKAQKTKLETALASLDQLQVTVDSIATMNDQLYEVNKQLIDLKENHPNSPFIAILTETSMNLQNKINQAEITVNDTRNEILLQIGGSREAGQENLAKLNAAISTIENSETQLMTLLLKRETLENTKIQLDQNAKTLEQSKKQLDEGELQYANGVAELATKEQEFNDGKTEYETNLAEFERQKLQAQSDIKKAREKIEEMGATWHVLDRNSHYSYRDYESCADRMDGISSVFPVFFFLVAALVCMTTMTRMVDEQRNEMGTLKALGYSRWQISAKYLIYAGSASIIGSIIGCVLGMYIFPLIIYNAWNIMYNLDAIKFRFQPGLMLMASAMVTLVVLAATWISIYKEMREVPAQLMRPKSAKAGKRILIERIPMIWSKFNFMQKVTIRNLFRYKKRFFMTVIGISGCSALLVAGFGLNDSISDIVPRQFKEVYHYDATLRTDPTVDLDKANNIAQEVSSYDGVNDAFALETLAISVNYDDKDVSATLNIIPDDDSFADFMTFNPETRDSANTLSNDGALVPIKTAQKLNIKVGDELTFKTSEYNRTVKIKVAGIFEQYTGHEIFITEETFEKTGIKETPVCSILLKNDQTDPQFENDLGSKIMNNKDIRSVSFYSSVIENFENMISSIKMIVIVLVLSAALLAFVVLYNLSNVNISERMREIATIKVLGFNEKEVNAYVNRETIILALIGSLTGLLLGIYLHDLIMALAELDTIRFGRTIFWQSYAYSVALTMIFTLIVNWIMKFRLRKIQMVESLKAVE